VCSAARRRSAKHASKRWQPPEVLSLQDVESVIAAAACERDRLLLTTLWATGARISEVLALRPRDVRRQGLRLPNLKNPSRPVKTAHLAAAHGSLPGELLIWARQHDLDDDSPTRLVAGRASPVCAPGGLLRRRRTAPISTSSLFVPEVTAGSASRHRSVRICSAMRACDRLSAIRRAWRWRRSRPAGRGCTP